MPRGFMRRLVYDGVQRALHWWLAGFSLMLCLTGLWGAQLEAGSGRAYFWNFHILAGKCLIVGMVARIVWGIIGPKHARFTSLFHMRLWLSMLKKPRMLTSDGAFGHHPQASASYLLFYLLVILSSLSGLGLAGILHGQGPWGARLFDELAFVEIIRTAHEFLMWSILAFAILHIGALIFHERLDNIPIAQSIVSGFQYRTVKENGDEL